MVWSLYDNGLCHERVKQFQPSVGFSIETSHLANQITDFYKKCNTGLKSVKPELPSAK